MPYVIKAECPKCGKEVKGKDAVEKYFGWRRFKTKNKTLPQSYCKKCRRKGKR